MVSHGAAPARPVHHTPHGPCVFPPHVCPPPLPAGHHTALGGPPGTCSSLRMRPELGPKPTAPTSSRHHAPGCSEAGGVAYRGPAVPWSCPAQVLLCRSPADAELCAVGRRPWLTRHICRGCGTRWAHRGTRLRHLQPPASRVTSTQMQSVGSARAPLCPVDKIAM